MGRNPQDITDEERELEQRLKGKPAGPQLLTPLVQLTTSGTGSDGPKDFRPTVQKVDKLAGVPDPSDEELAALEGALEEGIDPDEVVDVEVDDDVEEELGESSAPSRRLKSVPKG